MRVATFYTFFKLYYCFFGMHSTRVHSIWFVVRGAFLWRWAHVSCIFYTVGNGIFKFFKRPAQTIPTLYPTFWHCSNFECGKIQYSHLRSFIQHPTRLFILQFKMEDLASIVVLISRVIGFRRWKRRNTRKNSTQVRKRKERVYFTNIIQELMIGDSFGKFFMDGCWGFWVQFMQNFDLPKERTGGTIPIEADEWLSLTFPYLAI